MRGGLPAAVSLLAAWAVAACDVPPTEPGNEAQPLIAPEIDQLARAPIVVSRGASFRISAHVSGGGEEPVRALRIHLVSAYAEAPPSPDRPVQRILQNGEAVNWIRLLDDGADGDLVAGDRIFTSQSLVPEQEDQPPIATFYPLLVLEVAWEFADTTLAVQLPDTSRPKFGIWDADLDVLPVPDVVEIAPDARRTEHVLSLALPRASSPPIWPDATITRRYYELFDYDPDFILVYQPTVWVLGDFAAYYVGVRNEVTGNGMEPYDRSQTYGSAGGLQGVLVIKGGPSVKRHQPTLHEIGHRWFNYLRDLEIGSGHWNSALNRDYTGFTDSHYNDLELYLMGLIPADSVQPPRIGTLSTIQDVIDLYGPRTPAWPDAQKEFTLVTIAVLDRLLTPEEFALFEFIAAEFGAETVHPLRTDTTATTFLEATGGRATMTTRIP